MNFELTDDRRMLQDSLRRFLGDAYSNESIRVLLDSDEGYSPEVQAGLADLGVLGALFDEAHGGFGGAGFDIALVFEELGRAGAIDPLIDGAILAGGALQALGNEAQTSLLEPLIEGRVQLAFAHVEPASRYELSCVRTTARADGDGFVLDGHKAVVVNAPAADQLIVSARTSDAIDAAVGISLFLVPRDAAGVALRDYPLVGGGRAAEVLLEAVRVESGALLGEAGAAFQTLEYLQARATLALCAEALGLMERILSLTTVYLGVRKQFGQPIGKFQVLQHRMADLLIEIEQARSAVINLAGHIDVARDLRERHVSATKNLVGLVAVQVAEESIQMHGGIGMTQEYELAHLVRRLVMVDHRFGDATHHLERFIELSTTADGDCDD